MGLPLRIVGDETVGQTLSVLSETADIPVYPTIKEAIEAAE